MTEEISPKFLDASKHCEAIVILPAPLSILDCYSIFMALKSKGIIQENQLRSSVGNEEGVVTFKDVYDFYDFDRDRDMDEQETMLRGTDSGWFIHWDSWQRFIAVGGSKDFCNSVSPYPPDVRKHYFLEEFASHSSHNEAEKFYDEISKSSS